MVPTEATVSVNGVNLYTRSIGTGHEVVVLHGGPGAHHDYLLPQYDALATGRRLRYYDQRGGGRSRTDREVSVGWQAHVADLEALLDVWEIQSATLLGYSWGGLLAMLFAVEHRERVARLGLVSPAPATAAERRRFEQRFAARMKDPAIQQRREQLQRSGLRERDPDAYRRRLFELSVAGYFADMDQARDLTPFRVTERTQRAVWESLGEYDLHDRLRTLSVPALVAHGRHDPIPLSASERTAELLHAPLHIFEHSGHVPHVEEHARFVEVLNDFLPRR